MFLSLTKSIAIVVDVDWYFTDGESPHIDLIDELARVLHPIHGKPYFLDDFSAKHPISVMCVRKTHSGYERSEYLSSPEKDTPEPRNIRPSLRDKS